MRKIIVLAAASALGMLSACNFAGEGNSEKEAESNESRDANSEGENSNSSEEEGRDGGKDGEESGSDSGSGESASAGGIDEEFVVGRWTDTGDCRNYVEFFRNGQFVTSEDAEGRWQLEGRSLILTGQSATVLRISRDGNNRMEVTNPDGSEGSSTRC